MLLLMTACRNDEPQVVTPDTEGLTYLRLAISVPSFADTRANPSGGETGDGLEEGVWSENEISNVVLFIYKEKDGLGLNSPSSTPIQFKCRIGSDNLGKDNKTTYTTVIAIKKDDYLPENGDRIIVAANTFSEELFTQLNDSKKLETLGDVRDLLVDSPWKNGLTINKNYEFSMANASNLPSDGYIKLLRTDAGSKTMPNFSGECSIERTAARIDIMAQLAQIQSDGLLYSVKSKSTGKEMGTVLLTDAIVVNAMQKPTYLLKRVTRGQMTSETSLEDFLSNISLEQNLNFCGDETTTASLIPTNYVVEPQTSLKGLSDPTDNTLDAWYGESRASKIDKSTFDSGAVLPGGNLKDFLPYALPVSAADHNGNNRSIVIAYTNENTQHCDLQSSDYTTGIMLRGKYTPVKIYSGIDENGNLIESTLPADGTFYRFLPIGMDNDESLAVCFDDETAANDYKDWFINANPTYQGRVDTFRHGYCYYNIWLRHANDATGYDSASNAVHNHTFPMEYAIVRNNIYRVGFTFSGPGSPEPDLREPEEIQFRIFVRKWNLRRQAPIIM